VAAPTEAGQWQASGALIDVSVEVEGATAPLFRARDGSGRYYLEAHAGRAYAIRVANRSPERVAVVLAVDGLNVISGERERGPSFSGRPGRMYVIGPWEDVWVRGWRTSLEDVRQFTFVDERASYAARTARANAKMGWIEAWVYREQPGPRVGRRWPEPWDRPTPYEDTGEAKREGEDARTAPAPEAAAPPAASASPERRSAEGAMKSRDRAESYPGTGWGARTSDPAMLVDFRPQPTPAESITLRYEYARALRALGVLPPPWPPRDRLRDRERGEGFARPPLW
jgi:hypothetical protein